LRIGFPLMIKASAGGGGRGMRLVNNSADLAAAIKSARSESLNAFGSDELILEKALSNSRHIEIQIFADSFGDVIHLAERDCSVQRRHQKVIEEAPSMVLTKIVRTQMGEAAILAAKACDYVGAGTVEFLYDDTQEENNFYFLEMNTRLQVEHPVTELVTDLDLVALQLRVANGEALPIKQQDVTITGHAMEVRLYAEDPANNFMPQTGQVLLWQPATKDIAGVRVDSGIEQGQTISAFYDPMLAKLIAYGENREQARRRLVRLVQDSHMLGVRDNRAFLSELLVDKSFIAGHAKTNFIAQQFADNKCLTAQVVTTEDWLLAVVLLKSKSANDSANKTQAFHSSFIGKQLIRLSCEALTDDSTKTLTVSQLASNDNRENNIWQVTSQEVIKESMVKDDCWTEQLEIVELSNNEIRYLYQGVIKTRAYTFDCQPESPSLWLSNLAGNLQFVNKTLVSNKTDKIGSDQVLASMDGVVVDVLVKEGAKVVSGEVIAIIEAMKMEHVLKASVDGCVEKILTATGNQVKARQLLVQLKESS
jgi:geranyl-CoA carboxylase alpha subunit